MPVSKKCPRCEYMMFLTDWRPPNGMDSRLRCFHCSWCKQDYYFILIAKQLNKLEKLEEPEFL